MKKIIIFALILVLALAMAACGKKNDTNKQDTTVPTTGNSILPEMDPTVGTNIPDSNVNGNSTDTTGTTNTTDGTDNNPSDSNADTTKPDGTMK